MLKSISTLIIAFLMGTSFAQGKGVKNAAEDACGCLNSINISTDDVDYLSESGQKCIENAVLSNFERILKDYKLDPEKLTEQDGYLIGTDLTEILLAECEQFVALTVLINESEDNLATYENENDKEFSMVGELIGFKQTDNYYVYVEDKNGELHEFVWMTPLENSSNFEKHVEELVGEMLIISWEEIRLYSGEEEGYVAHKLLKSAQ